MFKATIVASAVAIGLTLAAGSSAQAQAYGGYQAPTYGQPTSYDAQPYSSSQSYGGRQSYSGPSYSGQSYREPSYSGNGGYGHQRRGGTNWAPSAFDWQSQRDRPGDYRCDAYWDANRTDCGAGWRDQRHRVRTSYNSGYGHGYRYGGHDQGYARRGYGHAAGGTSYEGYYGRPDIVFPGGRGSARSERGSGYGHTAYNGARDPGRIDWCRHQYRSYDPHSGYYRAYSGRLIFCG